MNNVRSLACVGFAFATLVAVGCSSDSGPDATLRVQNSSDFDIVEIHVAPVGTVTWGRNLIEGDVLAPGEALTLGVNCDTYDARLVDSDGVPCELHDLDLCLNNADWIIQNNTCVQFIAARAAREAAAKAAGSNATGSDAGSK
jgi:hypothetical protein